MWFGWATAGAGAFGDGLLAMVGRTQPLQVAQAVVVAALDVVALGAVGGAPAMRVDVFAAFACSGTHCTSALVPVCGEA